MTEKKKISGNTVALRQKAEDKLKSRPLPISEDIAALSPEQIQEMVHELRVHQIELEIQNEELRTAQADLEESRSSYFDLYDMAPVGYCTISEKGLILKANLTAAAMLDTHRGNLIKQPISRYLFKEDQDIYYLHLRQLLDSGEDQECELRLVKSDGALFWAHLKETAAQAEDGAPVCRVVLSDITGRKEDEKENQRLERQLQQNQKLESIGSLAGGIAHDFNNLLFPIVGLSEMMLNDFPPGSPEHYDVEQIFKAGKRGRELVQQILSFSRQSDYQPIPVHIQKILKEVFKLCRATIPADIKITPDIQTDCRPVMADPTQIHQIAMNLITNAFHAVEPTGGSISIQLKEILYSQNDTPADQLASGSYALLSVSDTGSGIDSAIINKIFDPYFTTKGKGRGTGLGLATVYGIVKAYGGDIRVYSEAGEGTCFHVYLPVSEESETIDTEKLPQPLPTGTEHILLIDDEKPIVQLEKQMLERLGYRTTCFTSSVDALAAFETDPSLFDLVITDMHMPNVTGVQLAEKMIAVKPALPVILCTGFSESINKEKADAMGIRGLLMKPAGMMDLAHKVREVLEGSL